MHLSSICDKQSHIECYIQEISDTGLPVVVFGAGEEGINTARFLEKHSVPVEAFCETIPYYCSGKIVDGKPVYDYEQLGNKKYTLVFAASSGAVRNIIESRKRTDKIYFNVFCPPFFDMTPEWVNEHIDALDETYHLLADEMSRKIFLSYLETRAHCLNIRVPYLGELCTEGEYFNDLTRPRSNYNALIDCGAYTGDTAERFLCFTRDYGYTGKVFAFEPDEKNFKSLETMAKKAKESGLGDVQCFPYAAGENKGFIYFTQGLGTWSHCLTQNKFTSNNGGGGGIAKVPVVSIDDVLSETPVTMLKMDIEGSELAALKGARKIITEQMPYLAICVYHKLEDMIEIPQYIQYLSKLVDKKYSFYLRHHYTTFNETILYAVPLVLCGIK